MTQSHPTVSSSESGDSRSGRVRPETETEGTVAIFRRRAVERYVRGAEDEALPRLARPRALLWLWIVVGLLTVACLAAGWHLETRTRGAAPPPGARTEAPGG